MLWIYSIALAGCIVIEVPPESRVVVEHSTPASVKGMQNLGYTFSYYSDDIPYWESKNTKEGWTFRVWEDGAFGISENIGKDFDAQTEAEIDFFKSLDISPEQASFIVRLSLEAMGGSDGEASACDIGLCCTVQYIQSQQLNIVFCEQ